MLPVITTLALLLPARLDSPATDRAEKLAKAALIQGSSARAAAPLMEGRHGSILTLTWIPRDPDVFDTWFTSSMTPQIASGWTLRPERHARLFPMDVRPQSHEIIRTWAFYTIAKALLHEGTIPWKGVAPDWSSIKASLLMHYATEDTWASPEFASHVREQVLKAGGRADLYVYQGAEHAFLDETRSESHSPEATALSWRRTVDFLRATLDH